MPTTIIKRDKRTEPFNAEKIATAIYRRFFDLGRAEDSFIDATRIACAVVNVVNQKFPETVTVEQVQDIVEQQLMAIGEFEAAKTYILYREQHRKLRDEVVIDPEESERVRADKRYFPTEIQHLQFIDKYARYLHDKGRRETWEECADRVIGFFKKQHFLPSANDHIWDELRNAILNMEALPSMRVMQMAGPALDRCHVGAYNCAYVPLDSIESFCELLYILMAGTGVGFSVESEYVDKLPRVRRQKNRTRAEGIVEQWIVADSTEGWCDALKKGLESWFAGEDVAFDFSSIRPQGAVLKTKGGRASGPEPLKRLLKFARERILARQGDHLTTVDCHDIACMCGDIVQVGGVRRAAEISLSDFDDEDMRKAKLGQFWLTQPQRSMANNSAVYEEKPTATEFMREWLSLAESGTGERGIYNRAGIQKQIPKRRKKAKFGVNPCGEIVLRSRQFCNLSIAVARPDDTAESLARKVRLAAIFGTLQSTLTRFKYISSEWAKNCEEERLLGVDITGQFDCPLLRPSPDSTYPGEFEMAEVQRSILLGSLKELAIATNEEYAKRLGINRSAAVTCVKPSGNSAQLLGCSSGLHPRYAAFYIRRIQISNYSPVGKLLINQGVPYNVYGDPQKSSTLVFEFPVKSPDGALTRHDLSAIQQLQNWADIKTFYTEHNPSITIYVRDNEWFEVGNWVYSNWDLVGGISFLPHDGGIYENAPYEEINQAEYERRAAAVPAIDWSKLPRYEREDETTSAGEFACVAGICEL